MTFRNDRAFTIAETLVCLACLGTLAGVTGALVSSVEATDSKDPSNFVQLYRGLAAQAADHPQNGFVLPGEVNRMAVVHNGAATQVPGRGAIDEVKNSHANMWSYLMAINAISPAWLVSDRERNAAVAVVSDYDYSAYQPAQDRYWDGDGPQGDGSVPQSRRVQADLAFRSCTSYAALPLAAGTRRKQSWRLAGTSFPVLGSRGPAGGDLAASIPGSNPPRSNDQSKSLLLHGAPGTWAGFVVGADGSVRAARSCTPAGLPPVAKGDSSELDNLFREDGAPLSGADAFLCLVRQGRTEGTAVLLEASWD